MHIRPSQEQQCSGQSIGDDLVFALLHTIIVNNKSGHAGGFAQRVQALELSGPDEGNRTRLGNSLGGSAPRAASLDLLGGNPGLVGWFASPDFSRILIGEPLPLWRWRIIQLVSMIGWFESCLVVKGEGARS